MKHKIRVLVVALTASLVIAANAFAGSSGSIVAGYGGVAGAANSQIKPPSHTNGPVAVAAPSKGTLPFTGFDVAIAFAGGIVLLVVGAGLRRTKRNTQ